MKLDKGMDYKEIEDWLNETDTPPLGKDPNADTIPSSRKENEDEKHNLCFPHHYHVL